MADDGHAEERSSFRKELLGEIEKLGKRIDDLDRKNYHRSWSEHRLPRVQ